MDPHNMTGNGKPVAPAADELPSSGTTLPPVDWIRETYLEEQTRRLLSQELFEFSPDGYLITDLHGVIGERDHVTLWRDPWMTDPATGFIQRLANRKFQSVHSTEIPNHGEIVAIRRPVCPLYLLQNFARCTTDEGRSRQRSHAYPGTDGFAVDQHAHLSRRRNREQLRPAQSHRASFGSLRPRCEDVDRTALPCRTVKNRLSIRRKPRRANAAAAKRELSIQRWRRRR